MRPPYDLLKMSRFVPCRFSRCRRPRRSGARWAASPDEGGAAISTAPVCFVWRITIVYTGRRDNDLTARGQARCTSSLRRGSARRGPRCRPALSLALPTGISRIDENGARKVDSAASVQAGLCRLHRQRGPWGARSDTTRLSKYEWSETTAVPTATSGEGGLSDRLRASKMVRATCLHGRLSDMLLEYQKINGKRHRLCRWPLVVGKGFE